MCTKAICRGALTWLLLWSRPWTGGVALAGLILTSNHGLRQDMRQDMTRMKSRLDERISVLESRLDGSISALESRFDAMESQLAC